MSETINLNSSVTVKLQPQEVQAIIAGLNELPDKFAQPVIGSILEQIKQAQTKETDLTDAKVE